MEFKTINQYLQQVGQKAIDDLQAKLTQAGSNATGDLYQSIDYGVKILGQQYIFRLELADHYQWVDKGRPPTKSRTPNVPPLKEIIYRWIVAKGIPVAAARAGEGKRRKLKRPQIRNLVERQRRSMAYAITQKIHRSGYRGNKFYSSVINDQFVENIRRDLSDKFKQDVLVELKDV